MNYPGPVVSTEWLAAHRDDPSVRIVDATVHLPDTGRDARAEYLHEHIPGAGFFDLDVIADPANPLPRKFPPAAVFAAEVGKLGIGNDTHVVAYDTPGLYSAARVWWLFRQYGYDRVSVLNGGLKQWKAEGRPLQSGAVTLEATRFTPGTPRALLALWPQVLDIAQRTPDSPGTPGVQSEQGQLIDARTPGRFAGTEQDRYPGTRAGHIPNSVNLYWADLLDPATRQLLPTEQIRERFTQAGLRWDQPVTATCGSGLTACILALGMHLCGKDDWQVYDGSWDEWGRRQDLPVLP